MLFLTAEGQNRVGQWDRSIFSTSVLGAVFGKAHGRDRKMSGTALMKMLLEQLFTDDILAKSSAEGKKGKCGLDATKVIAAKCMYGN